MEGVCVDQHKMEEQGHGRDELRYAFVLQDLNWLPQLSKWKDLRSVVEIVSQRIIHGKREKSRRFYLSSALGTAEDFSEWVRSHWRIENNLHWVADVVFREDERRASAMHCAENLGTITRLAMNIVKLFDSGTGLADARRFGCWDERYLEGLLANLFIK
jgi:predicted transposase YbfD/YdcC